MTTLDLLRGELDRLHQNLIDAVSDLSPEQWHWRPGDGCNHIAFSVWHYARTEDNVIQFVFQRKPTAWMEGGWDQKFRLDSKAQGTGMSAEEATALRVSDPKEFIRYMQEVWRHTDQYLAGLSERDLDQVTKIRAGGELRERPVRQVLSENLLTHGFSHLGEMWVLRGLQGFRGAPF